MSTFPACCICSSVLDTHDIKTEKPIVPAKTLTCCSRVVCLRCISKNHRYRDYCPYCQTSSTPSVLPQGLRDPPAYDSLDDKTRTPASIADPDPDEAPPEYRETKESSPDVLHFVAPTDSLRSLSLAYGVPLDALRRSNNMYSDHLLQGRKTVLIPGKYHSGGVSLSPRPLESEEEEIRKTKVRRFMVATKVAEYDIAVLYLEQASYELESAVEAYLDDEKWERDHPVTAARRTGTSGKATAKSIGMRRFVGLG